MRKDVCVIAKMKPTGQIEPLKILWEDGRIFEIDRVLEVKAAASTRGGGLGIRYKVRILGTEKFMFLDGFIWFVEV